jgi:glutathione S-transferase
MSSKQENKSPEYLVLNPRGKVPTLKDGDFVLYESLAIMVYLDSEYLWLLKTLNAAKSLEFWDSPP